MDFYNFDLNSSSFLIENKKKKETDIQKNKLNKNDNYLASLNDEELLEAIKSDKVLLLQFDGISKAEVNRRRNLYNKYLFSKIGYEIKDPYVKIYQHSIPDELCDEIINRFNIDKRSKNGITSIGIDKDIKRTKDLMISRHSDWKDIDDKMYNILNKYLNIYMKYLFDNDLNMYFSGIDTKNICDKGYNIQKYNQNDGFYIWHTDDMIDYKIQEARVLTYLWYLNTVEEGGETYFMNFKVKPEKGKLIIFPATWTYTHTAAVPRSSDKYIITGWIAEKRSLEVEQLFNESMSEEEKNIKLNKHE